MSVFRWWCIVIFSEGSYKVHLDNLSNRLFLLFTMKYFFTCYIEEDKLVGILRSSCFIIYLSQNEGELTVGWEYNYILCMRITSSTVPPLVQQTSVNVKFNIYWFVCCFLTGYVVLRLWNMRQCLRCKPMNYITFVISFQVLCNTCLCDVRKLDLFIRHMLVSY